MSTLGIRGGTTVTLQEAKELFRKWRAAEFGWVNAKIILTAKQYGEFHSDHMEDIEVRNRNVIGAAVSSLQQQGIIISTGEHRRSQVPAAHGRRSYVYRLTPRGERLAALANSDSYLRLPAAPDPGAQIPGQDSLFS